MMIAWLCRVDLLNHRGSSKDNACREIISPGSRHLDEGRAVKSSQHELIDTMGGFWEYAYVHVDHIDLL